MGCNFLTMSLISAPRTALLIFAYEFQNDVKILTCTCGRLTHLGYIRVLWWRQHPWPWSSAGKTPRYNWYMCSGSPGKWGSDSLWKRTNTLWPRLNCPYFAATFPNAFYWMKMFEFILNSIKMCSLLFNWQYDICWLRLWLGAEQESNRYLNQWRPSLLTFICVTQPEWVKGKETLFKCGK